MNLDQIKEIESLKEQVAQLELIRDEHDERGIDIGILVQNLNSVETKLTSLQSKSAELKEQVAQWETEYNGCSTLLNNAERTVETLEETIAQQAEAIQSLENHIADSADAAAIAMRKAWQLGQTYWQQADSEYYSQQDKSVVTQERFSKLVSDTCEEIKSIPTIQPSPEILQARDDRVAAACAQYVYAMGGTKGSVLLAEAMSSGEWRKHI